MSKGLGLRMQRILEELEDGEWKAVVDLAADTEGDQVGRTVRSSEESTRRACKRLSELGHLEIGYRSMGTGNIWPEFRKQSHQRAIMVVRLRQ